MEHIKLGPNTLLQNRYRILSLLKQGGMGRVYLAEDQRFRSQVAVKEACFTQKKLRQAFAHEAGLLHKLRHRVLPHVMDHFREGEGQYLVMQLFPGKDLEELLAKRKRETGEAFAVGQVLWWADQLLDALEYLHGHETPIIHRDIKPQNLMLTERGEVILLDFGLAKEAAKEMSEVGESLSGYTRYYAPLEQMRGMGADPRSDLYALAATIHRLITGHLPPDALTRAIATLEQRPDPLQPANELNGQVPAAVAAVLTRAMAQLPDERPATATEMRQEFRAAIQPQSPGYHDTATPNDWSWMEIAPLSKEPAIVTLGATDDSVSELTNDGRIIVPSSDININKQIATATFARFRLGGVRTLRIILSLLLLTIAVLGYWGLNRPQGSSAGLQSVIDTEIAPPG